MLQLIQNICRFETLLGLLLEDRVSVRSGSSSENFQLSTYGVGGDVKVHVDTYGKPDRPYEDHVNFDTGESGKWQVLPLSPQG